MRPFFAAKPILRWEIWQILPLKHA
jgi:hypothetical protein